MKKLCILLVSISFLMPTVGVCQIAQGLLVSAAEERPVKGDAGYFFALRQVPLSEKHYIFLADPLKRAVYVDGGKSIILSHTMTVRSAKGFDMYFSATDYNLILAVKEAKEIVEGTTGYRGTLSIRHGSEKHKLAVHGFQNR
ncbi:hypothetical protein [Dyadobacter jiangsuensis]|uniref:Uncharacterized protein n=1 Tax=Dyadobacter jiangsuensis TaxID=1591085 RepID=A0A2P8GJ10_9BACT|nr:hypothetical protein [Dyadobacter jiangsuensis]PSL33945.1 hypothetical protein CLV60_101314 [Dyadobacter jiangsuensis]